MFTVFHPQAIQSWQTSKVAVALDDTEQEAGGSGAGDFGNGNGDGNGNNIGPSAILADPWVRRGLAAIAGALLGYGAAYIGRRAL